MTTTPTPTGRLVRTEKGVDIVVSRTIQATIDDVWASVTEPDRTARWFGRWEGEGAPGRTIRLQMAFEEGAPWFDAVIDACEPPRRYAISTDDEFGSWHLEMLLEPADDSIVLTLVQHREDASGAGEIGPGWEYYLDMLIAAREGAARPQFDDYFPSQKAYYEEQAGLS